MTATAAWSTFGRFVSDNRVSLYPEPGREELQASIRRLTTTKRFTHRQWPDAYLAAFAKAGGSRLPHSTMV